ncbi:MAG: hypothetical protein ACREMA_00130 [Longimicrobiales bacterium]
MARTVLDDNLMTWEVYPSGGHQGFSRNPHIVFNCLSDRAEPPRFFAVGGDEGTAETLVYEASELELRGMLAESTRVG